MGESRRRPGEPDRRRPANDHLRVGDRQALRPPSAAGDPDGSSTRLPSPGETLRRRRTARARDAGRFRVLRVSQRSRAEGRRHRPVLLPSQDAEPSGGAAVERRLPPRAVGPADPGRHDQGDGPHRNASGRVRDGRNPLRAPRSHRRPQLRTVGLHLQLDQDAAEPAVLRAAGSRPGDDGGAVPAGLHTAADQDLPPAARLCHGRHGCTDSDQGRSRSQRDRDGQGPRRQVARGARRARRHVGGASRACVDRQAGVR